MRLSSNEKEVIMKASKESDYCSRGHRRTMRSLVEKGLAKYTSGFGWKKGEIIELTKEGMSILKELKSLRKLDRLIDANSPFEKQSDEHLVMGIRSMKIKSFLEKYNAN